MKLPPEAIEKLKEIHKKEYNEVLTDSEAQEMAHRLLNLFALLRRSLPQSTLTQKSSHGKMSKIK